MRFRKRLLLLGIIFLAGLLFVYQAKAEDIKENLTSPALDVVNLKVEEAGQGIYKLSFILKGDDYVQPGINYTVSILKDSLFSGRAVNLEEAKIFSQDYTKDLTLEANQKLSQELFFKVPGYLNGNLFFLVEAKVGNGSVSGLAQSREVQFKGNDLLEIDRQSCQLKDTGESMINKKILEAGRDWEIECKIKNQSLKEMVVVPTTRLSTGNYLGKEGGIISNEATPVSIHGKETKTVAFKLSTSKAPRTYNLILSLNSNEDLIAPEISLPILIDGDEDWANISNLAIDKASYEENEEALVYLEYSGKASSFQTSILDDQGAICGEEVRQEVNSPLPFKEILIKISRKCINPIIKASLLGKNDQILDNFEAKVKVQSFANSDKRDNQKTILPIFIGAWLISFFVFIWGKWRKKKMVLRLGLVCFLVILVIIVWLMWHGGINKVSADTIHDENYYHNKWEQLAFSTINNNSISYLSCKFYFSDNDDFTKFPPAYQSGTIVTPIAICKYSTTEDMAFYAEIRGNYQGPIEDDNETLFFKSPDTGFVGSAGVAATGKKFLVDDAYVGDDGYPAYYFYSQRFWKGAPSYRRPFVIDCSGQGACLAEFDFQCSGGNVRVCKKNTNGCLAWQIYEYCIYGKECQSGLGYDNGFGCVCPADECELGQTQCATEDTILECQKNLSYCNKMEPKLCGKNKRCEVDKDGLAQCVCANECLEGETKCDGDYIQSCQVDESGCLTWVNESFCTKGQTCSFNEEKKQAECVCSKEKSCDLNNNGYCENDSAVECSQDDLGCTYLKNTWCPLSESSCEVTIAPPNRDGSIARNEAKCVCKPECDQKTYENTCSEGGQSVKVCAFSGSCLKVVDLPCAFQCSEGVCICQPGCLKCSNGVCLDETSSDVKANDLIYSIYSKLKPVFREIRP